MLYCFACSILLNDYVFCIIMYYYCIIMYYYFVIMFYNVLLLYYSMIIIYVFCCFSIGYLLYNYKTYCTISTTYVLLVVCTICYTVQCNMLMVMLMVMFMAICCLRSSGLWLRTAGFQKPDPLLVAIMYNSYKSY